MTDPSPIGKTLRGRYRLEGLLGEGGMGAVYTATDLQLDRKVAVKMLHSHLTARPDLVARFIREAKSVGRVGHANIVQISDAYPVIPIDAPATFVPAVDGAEVFLVMEHLSGTTLGGLVEREGRVEARRLVRIVSQLLGALGAAHRAGIVHRDIKPENVFLTNFSDVTDVVKVLDFGIAKLKIEGPAEKLTQTGAFLGTPAYMSPEQVRGEVADQRADIYAVGVCMYHALSGQLPFDGTSVATVLVAVLQSKPPPLSEFGGHVPPALIPIVERALAKDKVDRFQTTDAMSEALARWVATESQEGHRPSIASSPQLVPQDRTAAFIAVPTKLSPQVKPRPAAGASPTWASGQTPPPPAAPWAAAPVPPPQGQQVPPQQQYVATHAPSSGYPQQQGAGYPHATAYPQRHPYPQQPRPSSNTWILFIAIPLILIGGCFATCIGVSMMGTDHPPPRSRNAE